MVEITTLSELTIDGKLSLGPNGSSKDLFAFYGDELREWFHTVRASHDAIMVGAGTVRTDDPELTVRYAPGPNPLRIVPSALGLLPLGAKMLNDGLPTLVAVSDAAADRDVDRLARKPGVEILRCGGDRVNLAMLMKLLGERGVARLIVEGGSRLLYSLHAAAMVDRIIIKHIPVIAGSAQSPGYLQQGDNARALGLSGWRLADCFVKSGVAITIYEPASGLQ